MATISFTTTAAEDTRIVPAVADAMGLTGNATQAQVKSFVMTYLQSIVSMYEAKQAVKALTPSTPINPV